MNFEEKIKNNVKNKDVYGNSNSKRSIDIKDHDVEFYKAKKGKILLDIIPYLAGTDNHPGKVKKGDHEYVMEYYEHKEIGAGKHSFLCMQMTFGKPCPICEERENMKKQDDWDKDIVKSLYPKRRVLYNVIDVLNKEAGLMLFSVAHFSFENEVLLAVQEKVNEGGEVICFPDLENGKTVACSGREKIMPKYTFVEFHNFSFRDREAYNKKMVNKTIALDTLLVIPTYEEVDNEFFGKEPEPIETKSAKDNYEEPEPKKSSTDYEEPPFTSPSEIKKEEIPICPHGHILGQYDEHPECDGCAIYHICEDS